MKHLNLLMLLLLGLTFGTNAQRTFSLEAAQQYAVQNNNQVQLAKLDALGAEGQIQEVRFSAIPTLNGNVQYQHYLQVPQGLLPAEFFGGQPGNFIAVPFAPMNNFSTALELNAILFDPKVFIGIKAAELYRELVVKQIEQTEFDTRYNVANAYQAALIAVKNKEILDKNIANLETTLNETREIFKEGFVEQLDVERLELSLENLKRQAVGAVEFVQINQNLLKFQMGYPQTESIQLTDDIETLIGQALVNDIDIAGNQLDIQNRPEYAVLKQSQSLNEMDIKSRQAEYLPSLYGFGSHSRQLQRNDLFDNNEPSSINVTVVGVQLNVPIFNYTTKYKVQQAQVALQKTKVQLEEFERAVNLEYENAKIGYQNAKRAVLSNQKSIELAERIYETTQIKYREGVGSSLEVTQAESELYLAQSNYITALYDLLVAKTSLEKAIGQ